VVEAHYRRNREDFEGLGNRSNRREIKKKYSCIRETSAKPFSPTLAEYIFGLLRISGVRLGKPQKKNYEYNSK
jgi:hypothetical protein